MNHALGFRASITDASVAALYDRWLELTHSLGRLPRRIEIDPLDLPRDVLPGMMILEREPSGRFLCRLAGTRMRQFFGFEPAGRYLDELMSPEAAVVRARIYNKALNERRAVFCRLRFAVPGREFVASDRLYVPALSDDTGEPTILFSGQHYLMASDVVGEPDKDGVYSMVCDDPVT